MRKICNKILQKKPKKLGAMSIKSKNLKGSNKIPNLQSLTSKLIEFRVTLMFSNLASVDSKLCMKSMT